MKQLVLSFLIVSVVALNGSHAELSASELAYDMYKTCLKDLSISCVKPKALAWVSRSIDQDEIKITEHLSVVRIGEEQSNVDELPRGAAKNSQLELFDKIESFLNTHAVKVNAPEYFKSEEARAVIPRSLLDGGLAEGMQMPLSGSYAVEEGRGFVRKVMLPFLIGLKLKTTVLVPLALALIALKTWKAMTLGLLSLVLSGALVIFKAVKPKIVNYEVVHYPHHHHLDHVEHVVPHHLDHYEHIPHHYEHIPHHVEHLPHHVEHVSHHVDHIPHHVENIGPEYHVDHLPHLEHIPHEHVEHINNNIQDVPQPWEPQPWARNGQQDAQEMAFAGQRRR